jgi:hypothetical protein
VRDLVTTAGEEIEGARAVYGTTAIVERWFMTMAPHFKGRHDALIFNFDEVMVAIGKGGHVVCTGEQKIFRKKHAKLPHFSVGPCINRFGCGPPPLIVVPRIQQRTIDRSFTQWMELKLVLLVAFSSGWVTERVFVIWARWFCEWLEAYRRSLGLDPTELAIVTLDNAPTHNCPEAMDLQDSLCYRYNVSASLDARDATN